MTDIWIVAMDRAENRHDPSRYNGREWEHISDHARADEILECYLELIAEGYAR